MRRTSWVYFFPFLFSISELVYSQKLMIKEAEYLMDDRFEISVSNLAPKQPFIIRASMPDSTGRLWVSYAGFYADDNGNAELSKMSPVHGNYSGINSMGLIQSMNLSGADYNRQRYLYSYKEPIPVKFKLEIDGKAIDSIVIVRKFIKKDVKIINVRNNGLVGTLFYPASKKNIEPIIFLGGSELS